MEQAPTLRELLELRFDAQDEKLAKIDATTTATNGRLRKAELAIAILQVGYVIGGIALYELFKWVIGRLP